MLDSIKDWFVDRLHKYMDAAREIVENDEGIRSAETYYSTVKAILKKETALLTKTFCIGMGGILATQLCGWLAELLGHGILKVISAVLVLLCVCIVAFILPAVIGLLLMLRTFFFANRSMADEWQKVVSDEQYADYGAEQILDHDSRQKSEDKMPYLSGRLRCGFRPGRLVVEGSRRRLLCVLLPWHCPAHSV